MVSGEFRFRHKKFSNCDNWGEKTTNHMKKQTRYFAN